MVFSSLIFLYAFFPLSLLVYALCRSIEAKNTSLLIFSLIFYAWGEPKYVFLLLFMALISWICALGVECGRHPRAWVVAAAVLDISLIGWFKYAGLVCSIFGSVPEFISQIALPVGISFYTFQLLTYVVDVYRGEAHAQKRYRNVLMYAALFHQCIAGPIVRYASIEQELFDKEVPRKPELAEGVSRFCAGLAKKALLANPCGELADTLLLADSALASPDNIAECLSYLQSLSVLGAWVGIIAYALHIYLDFSAYSDMAIGMGQMLGLHYPENFRYPYIAKSVTDFWRRWHITLSTFFRDYVYIPMGGSRCSRARAAFNTLVVWALTGLWHGASWNYVVWGLWFFVLLMVERAFLKKYLDRSRVLAHFYLLAAVCLGWVIFRFINPQMGWAMAKALFGANGNSLVSFTDTVQLQTHSLLLVTAMIASTPLAGFVRKKAETMAEANAVSQKIWQAFFYGAVPVVLLLLSSVNLVGDSYNPFLYFQF